MYHRLQWNITDTVWNYRWRVAMHYTVDSREPFVDFAVDISLYKAGGHVGLYGRRV